MAPKPHSYEKAFDVRWADLDANRHVRNTAYSDYATHTRLCYLMERGFSPARFEAEAFGPVIFREEVRFLRELRLGDGVVVDFRVAGLSGDGSRWRAQHDIVRTGGDEPAAVVRLNGAWLDLAARKLIAPPADLLELLLSLPRTEDFEELDSVLKGA